MKRLALVLLSVALLTGCFLFPTDEDRIVGTWESTAFGVTSTLVFSAQSDGAWVTLLYSDGSGGDTGHWSMDESRLTLDWGAGDVVEFVYELVDDDTLQLTAVDGVGQTIIMSRVS